MCFWQNSRTFYHCQRIKFNIMRWQSPPQLITPVTNMSIQCYCTESQYSQPYSSTWRSIEDGTVRGTGVHGCFLTSPRRNRNRIPIVNRAAQKDGGSGHLQMKEKKEKISQNLCVKCHNLVSRYFIELNGVVKSWPYYHTSGFCLFHR